MVDVGVISLKHKEKFLPSSLALSLKFCMNALTTELLATEQHFYNIFRILCE